MCCDVICGVSGNDHFTVPRSRSYDDVANFAKCRPSKKQHCAQLKSDKTRLSDFNVADWDSSAKSNGNLSVFWKQAIYAEKPQLVAASQRPNGFTKLQHSASWSAWDSVVRCILSDSNGHDVCRAASPPRYLQSNHMRNGDDNSDSMPRRSMSMHERQVRRKRDRDLDRLPETRDSRPNFTELDSVVDNMAKSGERTPDLGKPLISEADASRRLERLRITTSSSANQPHTKGNVGQRPSSGLTERTARDIGFLPFSSTRHKSIPREWSISHEKLERLKQLSNSLSCSVARRVSQFDNKTMWQQAQSFVANEEMKVV
ncbi:unnamed protein product [Soboliphyme baturini]|uniref:DUF1752 domain-containing protein n=1 Tax=Soboliphyme baturini TaxID=241478 RepID=A0A183J7B8_9BILA|nr:unnamed protein product [Soboliphyme baturini]